MSQRTLIAAILIILGILGGVLLCTKNIGKSAFPEIEQIPLEELEIPTLEMSALEIPVPEESAPEEPALEESFFEEE